MPGGASTPSIRFRIKFSSMPSHRTCFLVIVFCLCSYFSCTIPYPWVAESLHLPHLRIIESVASLNHRIRCIAESLNPLRRWITESVALLNHWIRCVAESPNSLYRWITESVVSLNHWIRCVTESPNPLYRWIIESAASLNHPIFVLIPAQIKGWNPQNDTPTAQPRSGQDRKSWFSNTALLIGKWNKNRFFVHVFYCFSVLGFWAFGLLGRPIPFDPGTNKRVKSSKKYPLLPHSPSFALIGQHHERKKTLPLQRRDNLYRVTLAAGWLVARLVGAQGQSFCALTCTN